MLNQAFVVQTERRDSTRPHLRRTMDYGFNDQSLMQGVNRQIMLLLQADCEVSARDYQLLLLCLFSNEVAYMLPRIPRIQPETTP